MQSIEKVGWEDQVESGRECLYEIHQMAHPEHKLYKTDASGDGAPPGAIYLRAARAVPHVKSMVKAIRRKDQALAIESGRAALVAMG